MEVVFQQLFHRGVIILIQLLLHVRMGTVCVSDVNNMVQYLILLRMGRAQNSKAGGEQSVNLPGITPES
jgi:hypothetical protein